MQRAWNEFFSIEVRQQSSGNWIVRIAEGANSPRYLTGARYEPYLSDNAQYCSKFSSKRKATRAAKQYCKQQHRQAVIGKRSDWIKV